MLAGVGVLLVIGLHFGLADAVLGLRPAIEVAETYDHSYDIAHLPRVVHPEDAAWKPMMRLIRWYSRKTVDYSRAQTIARFVALDSKDLEVNGAVLAEWTAPSTPFVVLYGRLDDGRKYTMKDAVFVGTIGELHDWIQRARDDFHFWTNDAVLGALSAGVMVLLWRVR